MKEWLASVSLVLLLAVLLGYLGYLAWRSWKRLDELKLKDRFAARNEFIKTTAQILGGAFFLITIYFTYQNLLVSENNLAETQEKNKADLSIARDKQTTELYVKAIEQLGSKQLEIRLGGIYALERIARDSKKDHWTIMEVLTAYVRENAPWPPEELAVARKKRPWAKPKDKGTPLPEKGKTKGQDKTAIKPDPDIQTVLTVLGRTAIPFAQTGEIRRLDLHLTNLVGADLKEANLQGADLRFAQVRLSDLRDCKIITVTLSRHVLQLVHGRFSNCTEV